MFFNVGHTLLENYPCHWQLGSFFVSTDLGWTYRELGPTKILYKGYADSDSLENLLEQISLQACPTLTGNFCVLVLTNNNLQIQTDRYRSFPIYVGSTINNLIPTDRTIWADSVITVHTDLSVTEAKFDVIGNIETSTMSLDHVLSAITDIVDQKTKLFLKHNRLPIRVFLTGGVDSMLVYSFLKKHTNEIELVKGLHFDYDYFWLKNSSEIKKFWAYNQIHHWTEPCVLASGTPGDEFMLRSPVTADLWLKNQNVRIIDLLQDPAWKNSMQSAYFQKDKNYKIFQEQIVNSNNLSWDLCNMLVNDWQHWHLGNTLTWTPLRDLEVFKLILRLPLDTVIGQVMNSRVSTELIEHNVPGLSKYVVDSKNSVNSLAKLVNLYQ